MRCQYSLFHRLARLRKGVNMGGMEEKVGETLGTIASGESKEVQDLLPKTEQKKRWEMSQRFACFLLISGVGIVFITMLLNFTLLLLGKDGMNDVAITMTTIFGGIVSTGSFAVYGSLQGFRQNSLNKHVTKTEIESGREGSRK